jgi:hypothetical protein
MMVAHQPSTASSCPSLLARENVQLQDPMWGVSTHGKHTTCPTPLKLQHPHTATTETSSLSKSRRQILNWPGTMPTRQTKARGGPGGTAAVQHRLLKAGYCSNRPLQDTYRQECTIEVLLLRQPLPFGLNPCVMSVMCAGPCRTGAATEHTSPVGQW